MRDHDRNALVWAVAVAPRRAWRALRREAGEMLRRMSDTERVVVLIVWAWAAYEVLRGMTR